MRGNALLQISGFRRRLGGMKDAHDLLDETYQAVLGASRLLDKPNPYGRNASRLQQRDAVPCTVGISVVIFINPS